MPLRRAPRTDYPSLNDYGLVGDGVSAALVSSDGGVDWWCPARFDAPSVFARLLDRDKGGHFSVSLSTRHRRVVEYVADTAILRSRLDSADGAVSLTTAMPHVASTAGDPRVRRLVIVLEGLAGEEEVVVDFAPAFDYARAAPRFRSVDGAIEARADGEVLRLRSTAPPLSPGAGGVASVAFRVREGDRHAFVLEHDSGGALPPPGGEDALAYADRAVRETAAWWREWAARCRYHGPYREQVVRSLVTLKLLQHEPSGAFVAAPTCSLPETLGGERNWDYRYAWLRDGVFIMMAFQAAGYRDEVDRFREWLAAIARRDSPRRLQMLYRVDGARDLSEFTLDHMEGYRRSTPVRVGNGAVEQHQLDTYGEILMCFPTANHLFEGPEGRETWGAVRALVDWVCEHWREPDSGIWEARSRPRHYVYSKAMAWVAVDHALQAAANHRLPAPVARWRRARDEIRAHVLSECFHDGVGAFPQAEGEPHADAANLLLPVIGIVDAEDPRVAATVERTQRDLGAHGLVLRYASDDGIPGSEGAFLVCSFWLAQALARLGRRERAREVVERAMATSGPLGLLAEEADPVTNEPLGNYPQALSHLGLVLAAFELDVGGEAAEEAAAVARGEASA